MLLPTPLKPAQAGGVHWPRRSQRGVLDVKKSTTSTPLRRRATRTQPSCPPSFRWPLTFMSRPSPVSSRRAVLEPRRGKLAGSFSPSQRRVWTLRSLMVAMTLLHSQRPCCALRLFQASQAIQPRPTATSTPIDAATFLGSSLIATTKPAAHRDIYASSSDSSRIWCWEWEPAANSDVLRSIRCVRFRVRR